MIIDRKDRKNQNCMVELGLRHMDVAGILQSLTVRNYSETVEDEKFPGTVLRVFGYSYEGHELYIKLALRKKVVCVSIHEKEYDMIYPYAD
ncbi:MAG: type II toxin-antitoxin system MqsR family toxin [Bacillota bacterium]|nr:type II toxin-antitoxin system MqsR family toxin [Bacillota bacterium]